MSANLDHLVTSLTRIVADRSFALHNGPDADYHRAKADFDAAAARLTNIIGIARSLAGGHHRHAPAADMASMLVALRDALAAADAEVAR